MGLRIRKELLAKPNAVKYHHMIEPWLRKHPVLVRAALTAPTSFPESRDSVFASVVVRDCGNIQV